MKAVRTIIIIILVAAGLVGCASTGSGKDAGTVIYENDFSSDDGAFEFHGGEINRVEDGVLHLKGDAWSVLTEPLFGDNSDTTFRIKFGDPVFVHLNFLIEGEKRLLMHVMDQNIVFHSNINNKAVESEGFEVALLPDRWYEFTVSIRDPRVTVSIDGEEAGSVKYHPSLPPRGHLAFEAHGEYEIDNLRVVEIGGGPGTGGGERLASVEEEEIRKLLLRWEEVIRNRDYDGLADLMWPDITLEFQDRKGRRTYLRSLEPVQRFRLDFFEELGPLEDYRLPEPRHHEVHGEGNGVSYGFTFQDKHVDEWVHAQRRDGEWRIGHLEIVLPVPGAWVTNRWKALADENDDGFLQGDEGEQLFQWTRDFYSGPHPVENPVDEFFDRNGNGEVEAREIRFAAGVIFGRGFRWFSEFQPGWATNTIDLNGDGEVTDDEHETILRYMAGDPAVGPDQVNGKERGYFLGTAVHIPFPDALFQEVPRRVANYLDEMADRNGDGRIDESEQEIIISSTRHHHEAENYFERALDLNHEGWVNSNDVLLALQASAMGKRVLAADNEPPYEVTTVTDSLLDRDENGMVDAGELEAAVAFLSGDMDMTAEVSQRLRNLADWNENGRIDRDDLEGVAGLIIFPHPVNPDEPMDRESDRNDDGFIEPAELGITGGVTSKGAVPTMENRIRLARRAAGEPAAASRTSAGTSTEASARESSTGTSRDTGSSAVGDEGFRSEYYQRLGKIQDRKLAVISLDTQTAGVDEETAAGIIVFVENAFVNVGKVRVVERKNIEEILSEYEFQSSGLIDENTAIEIGKLSGADIIVIGSINRVGGIFYLNIKLIDVKTGEIIGSNIARAKEAADFLDMCNEAVYMLF